MPTESIAATKELEAAVGKAAEESLRLHGFYKGKIQMALKCPIRDLNDFTYWYTPGVASSCSAIKADPGKIHELTNKSNMIAIVSDGSRVLGLGNIGPHAGLPVMEGKALLFKYLGGVDAVPICLGTQNRQEFVRTVQLLEPSFGGINLEDIAQPRCFRILEDLRQGMPIPVWHDDQQGTATALLAGLLGALKVVGKDIRAVRIGMIGMGAANVASYRLLKVFGVDPAQIVACDTHGTLHRNRRDIEAQQAEFPEKWSVCQETNRDGIVGAIAETLRGADVCIAFSASGPGVIEASAIRSMARHAIVFACANPNPEIWPWEAKEAGARIVATGRSDFHNQLNNSLVFPGIFRGTLDSRARTISDEMTLAAALELAAFAEEQGLSEDGILPAMTDWRVVPRIAAAAAIKAQETGISYMTGPRAEYIEIATRKIVDTQDTLQMMMREGFIAPVPQTRRSPRAHVRS